jgi:hypothetical protein
VLTARQTSLGFCQRGPPLKRLSTTKDVCWCRDQQATGSIRNLNNDQHILDKDIVLKALAIEHRKGASMAAYYAQLKKAQVCGMGSALAKFFAQVGPCA